MKGTCASLATTGLLLAILYSAAATAQQAQPNVATGAAANTPAAEAPVQRVGEAPADADRQPEVAVLSDQGGILSRAGRLTLEPSVEYTRADRNRVVFRGIEIPPAVLIGVFDINESRQDVLTAAMTARLGLSSRIELTTRVPFIYRSDTSVFAPTRQITNPADPDAGTLDYSVDDMDLGDIEATARFQLTDGANGWPYMILNVQATAPTGSDPFKIPRDAVGNPLKAATGAGFWAVTPSLTLLMPSEPAIFFATFGYTMNFGKDVNTRIGSTQIDHVDPGDSPQMSAGIALALNQRTSVSFGYAHNWVFGTKTIARMEDNTRIPPVLGPAVERQTRDLQLGRLLFGISYRANQSTTINWNVEVGATEDAADLRTVLRIPVMFDLW